jgi:hypothetical protein
MGSVLVSRRSWRLAFAVGLSALPWIPAAYRATRDGGIGVNMYAAMPASMFIGLVCVPVVILSSFVLYAVITVASRKFVGPTIGAESSD